MHCTVACATPSCTTASGSSLHRSSWSTRRIGTVAPHMPDEALHLLDSW